MVRSAFTSSLSTSTTGVHARVSYAGAWYDKADRLTATADVGTNGGGAWTRPSTAPARSDTVLVTTYNYALGGWLFQVIDPRGLERRTSFDYLGRPTKVVEALTNGTYADTHDKTTEYGYGGPNQLTIVKVYFTGGASEATTFVYGVSPSDGSTVTSNDLVREVRHPDKTTGASSTSERDFYGFNALGETINA